MLFISPHQPAKSRLAFLAMRAAILAWIACGKAVGIGLGTNPRRTAEPDGLRDGTRGVAGATSWAFQSSPF